MGEFTNYGLGQAEMWLKDQSDHVWKVDFDGSPKVAIDTESMGLRPLGTPIKGISGTMTGRMSEGFLNLFLPKFDVSVVSLPKRWAGKKRKKRLQKKIERNMELFSPTRIAL